jgi:hypothetical protein
MWLLYDVSAQDADAVRERWTALLNRAFRPARRSLKHPQAIPEASVRLAQERKHLDDHCHRR